MKQKGRGGRNIERATVCSYTINLRGKIGETFLYLRRPHQQKLNSVTITISLGIFLFLARFSSFLLFNKKKKNNVITQRRLSSTPTISRRFYFLPKKEFHGSIDRLIKKISSSAPFSPLLPRFPRKIWKNNFLLENFARIIKFLIKILALQFFPRSNILILGIPRNSAISILTESHLENFTRAKFNIFRREEYQGSSNGYQ